MISDSGKLDVPGSQDDQRRTNETARISADEISELLLAEVRGGRTHF